MSGGGEWGAKASLLSLDPQNSYGVKSEEDELQRFQRSFNGEDSASEAITRPGDYVQFFVDGASDVRQAANEGFSTILKGPRWFPEISFGVGEYRKEDSSPVEVADERRAQAGLVRRHSNHFGVWSAEGLYVDSESGHYGEKTTTSTKVNAPGTFFRPLNSLRPRFASPSYSKTHRAARPRPD